jgi:hypothetical protein
MKAFLPSLQDLLEIRQHIHATRSLLSVYRYCLRKTRNNVNCKPTAEEIKKVIVSTKRHYNCNCKDIMLEKGVRNVLT